MTLSTRTKAGLFLAGAAIIAYALGPVVWIASLSLKGGDDINNQQFWPTHVSWENYHTVFHTALFTSALRNSLGIALIATSIALLFATFVAYATSRLDYPGRNAVLNLALAVSMFPAISIATPLFNLWRTIGLYDTWPGLIIPYISLTLPISIWTLNSYFKQIPRELELAAEVDGATIWQAFRKVLAPLAAPGISTTAILAFLTAWNDFVFGITLTSTNRARPVPAALAFFSGASQFQTPAAAISAAAVIVTIPVVVLVVAFQRQIVSGLTAGAVKG
jgi:multiple sugar transport system permease protein